MGFVNTEKISKRQNEERILKMQFVARDYFNLAERNNYLSWVMCIVVSFFVLLPDKTSPLFSTIIPVVVDFLTFVAAYLVSKYVTKAAKLRNYVDSYILDIGIENYSDSKKIDMFNIVNKYFLKNYDRGMIQIHNNGFDNPPGVKDWYDVSRPLEGAQVQFECQRQNIWWNGEVVKKRIITSTIALIFLVLLFVLFVLLKFDIFKLIACFAGVIIKIIERLIENYKYFKISSEIDGTAKVIEINPSKEQLDELQRMINQRREYIVLEMNFYHKKVASELSKRYRDILMNK